MVRILSDGRSHANQGRTKGEKHSFRKSHRASTDEITRDR